MLEFEGIELLPEQLRRLEAGFASLPDFQPEVDLEAIRDVLSSVSARLTDNFPYFHPLYAGQMLKPPHPVARLAYAIAMFVNPNNHALDGGRASSAMEKEAVADIARMFGYDTHLGHLTSGGTMANLEALWVAGKTHPGKTILGSAQAHYTHGRISDVLQLRFEAVAVDARARMDPDALESRLRKGDVGTVVATLGTTGVGSVDPLPDLLGLREKYGFRLHVDAAYGGYFCLVDNLDAAARDAFMRMQEADSIVVDPHKHGLQPYGCGCILFKDPAVGALYKHDSPYTYFSSNELHLGEISLECSRAGASAVALWATQRLLPLERGGEFAQQLGLCREAAVGMFRRLANDARYLTALPPELDIIVWAPRSASAAEISARAQRQFDAAAEGGLHLALIGLPAALLAPYWPDLDLAAENVKCLRSCLMKPEHRAWESEIWEVLDQIADA